MLFKSNDFMTRWMAVCVAAVCTTVSLSAAERPTATVNSYASPDGVTYFSLSFSMASLPESATPQRHANHPMRAGTPPAPFRLSSASCSECVDVFLHNFAATKIA